MTTHPPTPPVVTLEGAVVISVGVFAHHEPGFDPDGETKAMLDELHLRKIDMAGRVHVVNPGGYIGASTRREIAYAAEHGKRITYMVGPEPIGPCTELTPETKLWAVHVHGPDDMLAMPDREAAEDAAWEINAFQASYDAAHPDTTGLRPVVQAFAEPWPWSAEGHAEELARAVREAEEEQTVRDDSDVYRLGVVL